jgi:hypothetical protein
MTSSAAIPIRILCLPSSRLLPFRRRDFAFYGECYAVCAWHAQAGGIASNLQPSTMCPYTARRPRYECDRCPQHEVFLGNYWLPFSHDRSVGSDLISNYLTCTRSSVPRHASTAACTKGMGWLRTSQARDARCLCTCVSAINTSKQHAQPFDTPSKAWVAGSLIIWHWVRSLWCVTRRSCISVRSRLRGRLAGGHGHVHNAVLSSSAASNASALPSPSCRAALYVGCVLKLCC